VYARVLGARFTPEKPGAFVALPSLWRAWRLEVKVDPLL